MNILVEGYFDQNFGDDIMILIAANALKQNKMYIYSESKRFLQAFSECPYIEVCDDTPNYDVVLRITGSGFLLHNNVGIWYAFFDMIKNSIKSLFVKKISRAVIGCNVGPFVNRVGKWLMLHDVKRYQHISVRDKYSHDLLERKMISNNCYPDIVFGMPQSWIPNETGEECLGVSAYSRIYGDNEEYYKKIANACDHFVEKTKKRVLLFVFDSGMENDYEAAEEILCKMKYYEKCEVIGYNGIPNNIIQNYARCGKIIGIRFHSIVLALRMGISVLPITYSSKTENMLNDLKYSLPWYNLDGVTLEQITDWLDSDMAAFDLPQNVIENARKHAVGFEEAYTNAKCIRNCTCL